MSDQGLESRDWSGAVRDDSPSTGAKVVLSGRFEPALAERVLREHQERGVPVSQILQELVVEAYAARDKTDDEPVTLRPSDVVRALRSAGRPAA